MLAREASGPVPPPELNNYQMWCRNRGVAAYGTPGDEPSMRAAVRRWRRWHAERHAWAAAHGLDVAAPVLEWRDGCSAPWDESAL